MDHDFDGFAFAFLILECCFFMGAVSGLISWWVLIAPVIGVVLVVVGYGLAATVEHSKRIWRETAMLQKKRAKEREAEIEALIERAVEQHVTYQLGIVNNVPEMVRDGVYGGYYPHKLEWPAAMKAVS